MYRIIIDDDHKYLCLPSLTDDEIALCKYIIAGKLNVCLVGIDSLNIVKVCSHFLNHVEFTPSFSYEAIQSAVNNNMNVMFIVDRTSYFGGSNCKYFTSLIREEFERTGKYNNQVIITNNTYGGYDPNDSGNFQSMINSSFMFYNSSTSYVREYRHHRKLTLQEYKDMKAYALYRADDPIRNSTEEFIIGKGGSSYDNDVCRCAEAIHTVNYYEQHGIFPTDSKLSKEDISKAQRFMIVNHAFRY